MNSGPKLTNVFNRTGKALIDAANGTGPRLIINEGGQGSSKTYFILQVIYNFLIKAPSTRTTFCSYALPHLKQGVMTDFDNILNTFGENLALCKHLASHSYTVGSSEIDCYGVEGNIALAHGPRRRLLFINECNRKITYEVFDHLFSRSEITLLDYNPDREFWLHEKVLPHFPHVLIRSNFTDNPYLPDNERHNILMKRDKPEFAQWWKVYGLGLMGKFEGAIFTNWKYGPFDSSLPYFHVLDFGFNDPDAMSKMAIDHKNLVIYVDEEIYKSGNSSEQLRQLMSPHITRDELVIGDCADARMISELRKYYNIRPVNKGKWNVADALKQMQSYEIIITEKSINLAKELNNYIWNDQKAGVPIGDFDHLISGVRYGWMEFTDRGRGGLRRVN